MDIHVLTCIQLVLRWLFCLKRALKLSREYRCKCKQNLDTNHPQFLVILQGPEHPNPGSPYYTSGFPRVAYIPATEEGNLVRTDHFSGKQKHVTSVTAVQCFVVDSEDAESCFRTSPHFHRGHFAHYRNV